MAQSLRAGVALTALSPSFSGDGRVRWLGGIAVLVLHLIGLTVFLWVDHARREAISPPSMTLLMLQPPKQTPQRPPLPPEALKSPPIPLIVPIPFVTRPPAPNQPTAQPEPKPAPQQPLAQPGASTDQRKTIEELFPSPEERRRRAMKEQQLDDNIANEKDRPANQDDCVVVDGTRTAENGAPSNGISSGAGAIPDVACKPQMSLKALRRRNEIYTPH